MKIWTAFLLFLLLLPNGCAYANYTASTRAEGVYDLYFRAADLEGVPGGDALCTETVYLPEDARQDVQQTAQTLLERLLSGPTAETLRSTVPSGTTLLSVQVADTKATVDLSSAYRALSGVSLSLADYAITMTLTQMPEIDSVSITVRGQELAYREKQTFSSKDVLFSNNEDVVGTVDAVLYFPDGTGSLIAEPRMLELYEGDTQVNAVLQALTDGPENRNLNAVLPEGFQIRAVWQEDGSCYVNFSSAALERLPETSGLELAVQSLRLSLQSLETVQEVRFLVDGDFSNEYGGVSLTEDVG